MAACYRVTPEGIVLAVRVTPNAGADRVEGVELRDDGAAVLRCRVRAVPDRGKANAAVLALLAGALGVPKSRLTVIAGETARLKSIAISGEPAALALAVDAIAGR